MTRSRQKNVCIYHNEEIPSLNVCCKRKSIFFQDHQVEIPEYLIKSVCRIYKQTSYSQGGSFIYTNVFTLLRILMQKMSLVFVLPECFCHRKFGERKIWIKRKTFNCFKDFRLLMENAKLMPILIIVKKCQELDGLV